MNIPSSNGLNCNCMVGEYSALTDDIQILYEAEDYPGCEVPFNHKKQSVLIFHGNDEFAPGAISEILIGEDQIAGTINVETSHTFSETETVLICVNNGLYFCCSDDYNSDGIIDYKDSAIFKVWAESETTDLSELQIAYDRKVEDGNVATGSNDVGDKGMWPDTKPCKLPTLPCADFNFDHTPDEFDSDIHTAATQLYGNVSTGLPKTGNDVDDSFTMNVYYPSLADDDDWSNTVMKLYPSIFNSDILDNDLDEPCPNESSFLITSSCFKPESTVCYNVSTNDNDNDSDNFIVSQARCIKQNDFDFELTIDYQGPYIQLSSIKYSLLKDKEIQTSFTSANEPSATLDDWTVTETYINNDWDLPGKLTYSDGSVFYSSFTATKQIDECGHWKVKLYAETPKCSSETGAYSLIGLYQKECLSCTQDLCEDAYPNYYDCLDLINNDVEPTPTPTPTPLSNDNDIESNDNDIESNDNDIESNDNDNDA